MSRAKTEEEVRQEFLSQIKNIVEERTNLPNHSDLEKCDGVAFSILNIFDGSTIGLPAMNIVLSPHPDDKQYHIDNGMNWYESKMIINNTTLHHEYVQLKCQ